MLRQVVTVVLIASGARALTYAFLAVARPSHDYHTAARYCYGCDDAYGRRPFRRLVPTPTRALWAWHTVNQTLFPKVAHPSTVCAGTGRSAATITSGQRTQKLNRTRENGAFCGKMSAHLAINLDRHRVGRTDCYSTTLRVNHSATAHMPSKKEVARVA